MPRLLANQRLPLKRFWIPLDGAGKNQTPPTLRLHDGILPDPEDSYGNLANPTIKTVSEIEIKRCFALLGQPGLGKTIVVNQWIDELIQRARPSDAVIPLTGRGLAAPDEIRHDTVESPEWKRARLAGGEITLILDGLDEALQRLPVLLTTLWKCLKDEPREHTRLALVSRVADWRDSRAGELFALWPESERGGAFELCPLRWRDVQLAAEKSDLNADKFQTAVLNRRVAWMAGRPKLLLMLLEEFREKQRLPDSRRELFLRAAHRMCQEHDPERHEVLDRSHSPVIPTEHLFPIVGRIAASLLLNGKSYILSDEDLIPKVSDIPLPELLGGTEPLGEKIIDVDKAHLIAALDTAHFVACGPGRLGFDHQAMAEFMAAQYLIRCTTGQLRSLLSQRLDGRDYLSPQFREISAWIAINHREFRDYVLLREPRLLLEADAVELDKATRRDALLGLLAQLARGEASDEHVSENSLRSLGHPSLIRQLRLYINDASQNIVVRRTAIRITGVARFKTLKADLWRLLTMQQQVSVRQSAIRALVNMGSPADKRNFLRALRGDLGPNADEELKGEALGFLVPRYLSVPAVIKHLTPRDESVFGAYYSSLHDHLPSAVRVADVIPILNDYQRREKRHERTGPIRPIALAAVKRGLCHFSNVSLRHVCIQFLAKELQARGWETTWEGFRPASLSKATEIRWRRALLDGFVAKSKGSYIAFVRFNLWPQAEDFAFVLGKIRTARGAQLGVWTHLMARLTFQGIPVNLLPQFRRTYNAVSAFREKLPRPTRFGLEETLRRRARACELWGEVWRRRAERRKAEQSKGKLTIGEVLQHLPDGGLQWWINFTRVLRRVNGDHAKSDANRRRAYDPTTWYGWRTLSEAHKKAAKVMATRFLLSVRIPDRKSSVSYVADEAAVCATALLLPDIQRSSKLRAAIKTEWIPGILNNLYDDEPQPRPLSSLAYRLDSASCIEWCKRELERLKKQSVSFYTLARFDQCWDQRLTLLISNFALRPRQEARSILYAVALLRQVAASDALDLWKTLNQRSTRRGFDRRVLGVETFVLS